MKSQVPELEEFGEEEGVLLDQEGGIKRHSMAGNAADRDEEVKITRIRGSIRGWWTVLQGVLDDEEGGVWFLKRERVRWRGEEMEAWAARRHFPEKSGKRGSI